MSAKPLVVLRALGSEGALTLRFACGALAHTVSLLFSCCPMGKDTHHLGEGWNLPSGCWNHVGTPFGGEQSRVGQIERGHCVWIS